MCRNLFRQLLDNPNSLRICRFRLTSVRQTAILSWTGKPPIFLAGFHLDSASSHSHARISLSLAFHLSGVTKRSPEDILQSTMFGRPQSPIISDHIQGEML